MKTKSQERVQDICQLATMAFVLVTLFILAAPRAAFAQDPSPTPTPLPSPPPLPAVTGWYSNGNDIYNTNSGNVGIGTTSPNDKLDVAGNIRLESGNALIMRTPDMTSGSQNAGLSAAGLTLYNTTAGTSAPFDSLRFNANRAASGFTPTLFAGIDGGKENSTEWDAAGLLTFSTTVAGDYNHLHERMRIASNGNVGIGTANPAARFQVFNFSQNHAYSLSNWNGTGSQVPAFFMNSTDNGGSSLASPIPVLVLGRAGVYNQSWDNIAEFKLGRYEDSSTNARTRLDIALTHGGGCGGCLDDPTGNTVMSLQSGGNVGIGTTSPGAKLQVMDTISGLTTGASFIPYHTPGVVAGLQIQGIDSNGTTYRALSLNPNGGNVGIGTTNPGQRLSVAGAVESTSGGFKFPDGTMQTTAAYTTTTLGAADISSGQFGANTGGGNYSFPGSVGIGVNSPNSSLDVQGTRSINVGDAAYGALLYFGNSATNGNGGSNRIQYAGGEFGIYTTQAAGINFYSNGSNNRLHIDNNGNVGIGTAGPGYRVDVQGGQINSAGGFCIAGDCKTAWTQVGQWTTSGANIYYNSGNVGIGKTNPTVPLDVVGDLNATGTITGGNIKAKYQDVAEWVPASQQLPTGTVVVLDTTKANQVISSSLPYDTRVAGVVSEQPGIALGEMSENKVLVATTGRVRVKVDATHAPIQIGDLLVTSDIPGVAMKSEPINLSGVQIHRPGTLIGKALEPLATGKGEILVLLSLQ